MIYDRSPRHWESWNPIGISRPSQVRVEKKGRAGFVASRGITVIVHWDETPDPELQVVTLFQNKVTGYLRLLAWT
jgi:hypothetical protein